MAGLDVSSGGGRNAGPGPELLATSTSESFRPESLERSRLCERATISKAARSFMLLGGRSRSDGLLGRGGGCLRSRLVGRTGCIFKWLSFLGCGDSAVSFCRL